MSRHVIINIEKGMPSIDEARKRLIAEIKKARTQNVDHLKIVHGYGSSGVGGSIAPAIRKSLKLRRKEGLVADYVSGENFNAFNEIARTLVTSFPELKKDPDFNRNNPGITIASLKRT